MKNRDWREVLVENAGGVCYNLGGKDWKLDDTGIICGNNRLVAEGLGYIT